MPKLPLLTLCALGALALAATCDGDDATRYYVRVSFNESVTQADLDETDALLRTYDEGLDFLIQESFPPTGVAYLEPSDASFCEDIEAELGAKSYVTRLSCGVVTTDVGTPGANPDAPVTYP